MIEQQTLQQIKEFPVLDGKVWRSAWPYLVTLSDGVKLPAYPVVGRVNQESQFRFGDACTDRMWYVADKFLEHNIIKDLENARVIDIFNVIDWQEIK